MKKNPLKDYGQKHCLTCTRVLPLTHFGEGRLRECDDCRAMRGTPAKKRCSKCGEEKPGGEFNRSRTSASGLSSQCTLCARETTAKCRKTKADYRASYERERYRRRKARPFPPVPSKQCCKCGQVKAGSEFYLKPSDGSGLQSRCKDCMKVYAAEYYRIHNERIRARIAENRHKYISCSYVYHRRRRLQRRLMALLGKGKTQ